MQAVAELGHGEADIRHAGLQRLAGAGELDVAPPVAAPEAPADAAAVLDPSPGAGCGLLTDAVEQPEARAHTTKAATNPPRRGCRRGTDNGMV